MKKLIIGNFRTGSWFLHDSFIEKGFMPLGELGNNTLNDRKNKISKFFGIFLLVVATKFLLEYLKL